MTTDSGLHGIDLGDGGRPLVFCERENLLAMYPHVCPGEAAAEDFHNAVCTGPGVPAGFTCSHREPS